jgi:putative ABC transport system permease protein
MRSLIATVMCNLLVAYYDRSIVKCNHLVADVLVCYSTSGLVMRFDNLRHDFRHAIRALIRSPGFTLAATATLALGIGANVAMFSVLYAVVLKPLPYRDPDRLVLVQVETAVTGTRRPLPLSVRLGEFDSWKKAQTFEQPALYTRAAHALLTKDGTEQLDDALVSTEFFSTMAGSLTAGRPLTAEDDSMPSCVISERLARRLFSEPTRAVGQPLTLNGRPFTIVGVAGAGFKFPERVTDAWLPARFVRTYDSRDFGFQMIGRARGDASIERINAEVEAIARAQPGADRQQRGRVVRLADQIAAPVSRALAVLFSAVTLVLVVACINLANLLLARNASRARDLAIQSSLGASRTRLIAQSLVESACLAVLGAAAGLFVAYLLVTMAVSTAATFVPNIEFARLDLPSLLFAAGVMTFAALASGAAPAAITAWSAREPRLTVVQSSRPHQRARRALCVAEWSVAFVLLVGASLLARSLTRLMTTDLGVSTDHVVTASLNFAFGQRPPEDDVIRRVHEVLDRIKRIPGVVTAGVGTSLPPQASRIRITLRREGESVDYAAAGVPVSPEYFQALHIPLVQGRLFNDSDDVNHPDAFIMSADTARRLFGSGDVIGRTMNVPRATWLDVRKNSAAMTLVGVIGNVKYSGLSSPPDDAIYRPFAQQPWIAPFLVVRTTVDPASLMTAIRREIVAADPVVVVSAVRTLDSIMSEASAQPRSQAVVLAALTTLALVMAAVGLYGVVAFSVVQRTNEIGIRLALGSSRRRVLLLILREGITIGVVGLALGIAAALALVRLLQSSLFGISPTDPVSFGVAALTLLAVAALASYLPARRATAVNPLVALRYD